MLKEQHQGKLTKEQKILLNLASMSVATTPLALVLPKEELDGVDWKAIAEESMAQAIGLSAYDAAAVYKEYIPKEVYTSWKLQSLKELKAGVRVALAQAELIDILESNGVPYAIIKGTASAFYYPKPELRALGDVDFLINPEEKEEIGRLLEENGYEKSCADSEIHVVFEKEKAHLEMHLKISGMPKTEHGERIKSLFKNALSERVEKVRDEHKFHSLDDIRHGIVLLLHTYHHLFSAGFGLRHLCDWAAFVASTQNQPFWEESLLPFLKEAGLMKFAAVLTKICVMYLCISCPVWAEAEDEQLCAEFLCDILRSGNFGRKNNDRGKSAALIAKPGEKRRSAVGTLAYKLHVSILDRYPIVKKVWILYPFVYAWKVVRNIFFILIKKRASIRQMKPEAIKRQKLYDKLRVFETTSEEK